MNETVRDYCSAESIVFTRCRPYRKNDQAWVEQKNGAIVRRIVGYRRYEGFKAAKALAQLYASVRLFVNFFQPSFKLAGKERHGARVRKRYHPPATPFQRLLADPRTSETTRRQLQLLAKDIDPVRLLQDIRARQEELVTMADQRSSHPVGAESGEIAPTIDQFLAGLRTAWKTGNVRPTSRPKPTLKRERRRPDPLVKVTETLRLWFSVCRMISPASTRMNCSARCNGASKSGAIMRQASSWLAGRRTCPKRFRLNGKPEGRRGGAAQP
jgi:hypothetical protein